MRIALKNHQEVAHKWANRSQETGRASRMFFEGPSIYSYGHHFEIARHVPRGAVLFTSRGYSSSTAKHKSYTARAIPDSLHTFTVPSFTSHEANAAHYLAQFSELRDKALKARSNGDYLRGYLAGRIGEGAAYLAWVKSLTRTEGAAFTRMAPKTARALRAWIQKEKDGALFTPAEIENLKARMAAARIAKTKEEEARRVRHAAALEEARVKLQAWARGEEGAQAPSNYELPTMLRIKDKRIETSRGAQITLRRAVELWEVLTAAGDVVGMDLDGYRVSSWDGAVLTVGCHKIPSSELARLGAILGLSGTLTAPQEVA